MNSSQVPKKFGVVWGSSASPSYIQAVPDAYSGTPGSASLALGWGPETFQDPSVSGTAPLGEYENGIWNQATANMQWIQAGGIFQYDAAFATKIGGYPKGAILAAANYSAFWKSTVENNTVSPDFGTLTSPAAGWSVLQPGTYPWSQITGAPTFTLESEFTGTNQSLSTNGYQKFPGGLIEQWGQHTNSADNETVSFPIAFPSAVFNVSMTLNEANSSSSVNIGATGLSTTGFTAHAQAQERPFFWRAIGR